MVCPCCTPQDPCYVLVEGQPVSVSLLDPLEVLDVTCWGGAVPDGTQTLTQDGNVLYQIPSGWLWSDTVQFAADYPVTLKTEQKLFSAGISQWQFGYPEGYDWLGDILSYKQVSATECFIFGHVNVQYSYRPGRASFDVPENYSEWLDQNTLYRWQAEITNGEVGPISVTGVAGYEQTYDNTGQLTVTEKISGPAPVVTLTFAP